MISVCIATYNGARYIEVQLKSILGQLTSEDEIIVSDDASADDTLAIVSRISSESATPIHIFRNEQEHGYTPNFENALRQAKGDYIFLSDQDDCWMPEKVSTVMQYLSNPEVSMVVTNASITDANLKITERDYFSARGVHKGFWGNIYKFGYLGCCLAFPHRLLDTAMPFPKKRKYCTHDNWLYLCAETCGKVVIIEQPLILYRRHEGVSTTGALNAHKPLSFRIRYRLYLLGQLLCRKFL